MGGQKMIVADIHNDAGESPAIRRKAVAAYKGYRVGVAIYIGFSVLDYASLNWPCVLVF